MPIIKVSRYLDTEILVPVRASPVHVITTSASFGPSTVARYISFEHGTALSFDECVRYVFLILGSVKDVLRMV